MRVIVINPWDQSVREAEHNGHYKDYYRLLSGPTIDGYEDAKVRCFTLVEVGDRGNHLMFVDDEGLLTGVQAYFQMGDATTPFAGRGVIARSDGSEDETGATLTVDQVARDIKNGCRSARRSPRDGQSFKASRPLTICWRRWRRADQRCSGRIDSKQGASAN